MIKYQQLLNAKALLELGSFRKAAFSRNISQPAFSRSIAKFEEFLGVTLFHRHPTGISTTVYGEVFRKYGQRIVTAASDFEREIRIAQDLGMGELSVAMGPYPAELSGHQAIGKLISDYPDIRCKITVSSWDEVEKLVTSRRADIGLAESTIAEKNKHLKVESVGKHSFVFYCRSGHPLLQKSGISKGDLNQYPLVLIKLPQRLEAFFPGKLFAAKNSDYLIPSVEVQDLALSRQIVAESDAISAVSPVQISRDLSEGIFSIIPLRESWMTLNYGFIYLRDRALSPASVKYMELVRELEVDLDARNRALIEKNIPI